MTTHIEYTEKETRAKTIYTKISNADMLTVINTLNQCLVLMTYANADRGVISGEAEIYIQMWNSPTKDLTKGRFGLNSPCSMTSGLLYNFEFGGQYDFTLGNLEDIEMITHFVAEAFPEHIDPIRFTESFFDIG